MVKLSIIIPVYNAEKYLDRCLKSLLCQSKDGYEIILIDDGSTDNSGKICDKYVLENKNIKVFHNQNKGVSYTRNFGIKKAEGDYIAFIDADDFVSSNYFATIFDFIQNKSTDCFIFNLYREETKGVFIAKRLPLHEGDYSNPKTLIQYSLAFYSFFNASYTKIYKREILLTNKIRFNENIKLCEDNIFSLDYINAIKSFTLCDAPLYYYTLSTGSATQKRKLQYFSDDNFLFFKYLKIIEEQKELSLSKDRLCNTYLRRCFYNIDNLLAQKIDKKTIQNALNSTEMVKYLLNYNFTLNYATKLTAKRLRLFSKGRWLSYKFVTFRFKVARRLNRILKAIRNK